MKQLIDIPKNEYNNLFAGLKYLRTNKTIGNENAEYNGIFHVHWRGEITDKQLLVVKSILCTQKFSKIYFWIEDNIRAITSPSYPKLLQFSKFVDIKVFDNSIIDMLNIESNIKNKIKEYYNRMGYVDIRYRSDVFRFIVLTIFGGVYVDLDMFLLRDLTDIKINQWCSKMGPGSDIGDGAILKLDKNSDECKKIYLNDPHNPQCYIISNSLDYKHGNLNITSLPSSFFDILWGHSLSQQGKLGLHIDNIKMTDFNDFFKKTNNEVTINTFFKGCFAYHWHNRWNNPEYKDSFAGKLNADMDRIIKEKYNIKPIKIFQDNV